MCEIRPRSDSEMPGSLYFYPEKIGQAEGGPLVTYPLDIQQTLTLSEGYEERAKAHEFYCKHPLRGTAVGWTEWERIPLEDPGIEIVCPAGTVLRAVPKEGVNGK